MEEEIYSKLDGGRWNFHKSAINLGYQNITVNYFHKQKKILQSD